MPTFPNEYQPDNTDDRELAEYAAEFQTAHSDFLRELAVTPPSSRKSIEGKLFQ